MPRFNATRLRQRNRAEVARAVDREHAKFRRCFEALNEIHAEEVSALKEQIAKLRHNLGELVRTSGILSDTLDRMEQEHAELNERHAEIEGWHTHGALVVIVDEMAFAIWDPDDLPTEGVSGIDHRWARRWIETWVERNRKGRQL